MATTVQAGGGAPPGLGAVFGTAAATIAAMPAATFGIAFLFGALPTLVLALAAWLLRGALIADLAGAVGGLASLLVTVTSAMLTQGALAPAALAQAEGRRVGLGECTAAGLRALLPLAAAGMLMAAGVMLGLMILMFPGIMLYVMWSVSAPAAVAERTGPRAALRRSRDLTRGVRWRVFGLLLAALLVYWLVSSLATMAGVALFGARGTVLGGIAAGNTSLGFVIGSAAVQTLTGAGWGALVASLYVALRTAREGPETEALAEIFR